MKTASLSSACFALALSTSFGGPHEHGGNHKHRASHASHAGHANHSDHADHGHDVGTKESFLQRLAIAPAGHGYGTNLRAFENAAASASTVVMLGKVEYALGKSWLGPHSAEELSEMLLNSGMPLGPESLLVVLGYADRSGRAEANYHLSETRAELVREHLEHLDAQLRTGLRTASIAMGEEVELCEHDFGHNRVAEIWLVNFARPAGHVVAQAAPVFEQRQIERPVAEFIAPNAAPAHTHDDHEGHHHSNEAAPASAAPAHVHGPNCHHEAEAAGPDDATMKMIQQLGFAMESVQNRPIGGQEVTALPVAAILSENGRTFVLAINNQAPEKIERWEVSLGRSDGTYVEALTGVFPGDTIICKPPVRQ